MNDALALSKATVGIAMGAGGSEVAIEASDVALVKSDLQGLVFLRRPAAGLNTEYIDPQITQISADYVAC